MKDSDLDLISKQTYCWFEVLYCVTPNSVPIKSYYEKYSQMLDFSEELKRQGIAHRTFEHRSYYIPIDIDDEGFEA